MDIKLSRMQKSDLDLINLEDFDDFWNINILKNDLESENSFYIIAEFENKIVGFAGINFILDEAHIANIAVKKDKRNLKIGSKLLETLIDEAKDKASFLTLEVNEQNLPAIHLYKKYGFKTIRQKKKIL